VGLVEVAADEEGERPLEGEGEKTVELQLRRGRISATREEWKGKRANDGKDLKNGRFYDDLLEEGSTRRRAANDEGKGVEQS
jgi:hypothetical protein